MKVTSAEFIKSVTDLRALPKAALPEVAFAGRSNVGKSSLINCLLNRKKLAKTSSTPGKTRQLNYYRINGRFYFVDLPGYGFAKVSKSERQQWQHLIENYIQASPHLCGVVSIIDSRIGPTELDLQLMAWLHSLQAPNLLVATKADKVSKSKLQQTLAKHKSALEAYLAEPAIPFSATHGTGKKQLWRAITTLMEKAE